MCGLSRFRVRILPACTRVGWPGVVAGIPLPCRRPNDMAGYIDLASREQANGVALPCVQIERIRSGRVIGSTRYMNTSRKCIIG